MIVLYVEYKRCEQKGCHVKENREQRVISNRQKWCGCSKREERKAACPTEGNAQQSDVVTNFIWPYLHQFFNDSHGLNSTRKPLKNLLIDTSYILKQSIMVEILGRSTDNYHGTVY